jgi:hypothetical protein
VAAFTLSIFIKPEWVADWVLLETGLHPAAATAAAETPCCIDHLSPNGPHPTLHAMFSKLPVVSSEDSWCPADDWTAKGAFVPGDMLPTSEA